MYIYEIEMPWEIISMAFEKTFSWRLGEGFESVERHLRLGSLVLGGYVYKNVEFDFYQGLICITLPDKNFYAVKKILQSFSVCCHQSLSFPLWANKKSYPL